MTLPDWEQTKKETLVCTNTKCLNMSLIATRPDFFDLVVSESICYRMSGFFHPDDSQGVTWGGLPGVPTQL